MKDLLKLIPKYTGHEAPPLCARLLANAAREDKNTDDSLELDKLGEVESREQSKGGEYLGGFLEYRNSLLGWVAMSNGSSAMDLELLMMINDKETECKPIPYVNKDATSDFRLPPGGFCYEYKFRDEDLEGVDLKNVKTALLVRTKTKFRTIDLVVNERFINLEESTILNRNPLLSTTSSVGIPEWKMPNADLLGIRVNRYSISGNDQSVLESAKKYTRIAFTGSIKPSQPFSMLTQLAYSDSCSNEVIELAIRTRADRQSDVACKLLRNNEVISTKNIFVESHWAEFRVAFGNSKNSSRFRRDKYEVQIDWNHSGRGYVDIAACAVGVLPSLRQVFIEESERVLTDTLVYRNTVAPGSNGDYVNNGDFSRWSNGVIFDEIHSRQELADGWRVECRKEDCSEVSVLLEKIRDDRSQEKDGEGSKYGMKVDAKNFDGIMRFSTYLDRNFINEECLRLSIDAHSCGKLRSNNVLTRLVIIGRGNGQEKVLHVIARKQRIRASCQLVFDLDEEVIVNIRRNAPKRTSFFLGIEVERNSEMIISRVSLEKCIVEKIHKKTEKRELPYSDELTFEDTSITEQAFHLKGLSSWTGPLYHVKRSTPNSIGGKTRDDKNSYSYDQPTIRRPERGFPSIDIVVPIYNAVDVVKECIKSVIECTAVPYTLICIDDASDEETSDWLDGLQEVLPQITLLRNDENIGYTKTVNRGLEASNADWVCVLNSDCIVTKNWLEHLVDVAVLEDRIGIVSPLSNAASYQSVPRIKQATGEWHFNPLPAKTTPEDMSRIVREHSLAAYPKAEVANGFCQLISRDMLDSIGLLDESTFPRGFGEENDLCARAIKNDWQIRIADDTYVYHVKSQSFGHVERKLLSKDGSKALLKKHPDVDWKDVTKRLEDEPALREIRKRIVELGF